MEATVQVLYFSLVYVNMYSPKKVFTLLSSLPLGSWGGDGEWLSPQASDGRQPPDWLD